MSRAAEEMRKICCFADRNIWRKNMKRKTVTAFLMSLCLVMATPGVASAADIEGQMEQTASSAVNVQTAEETKETENTHTEEQADGSKTEDKASDAETNKKAQKEDSKERASEKTNNSKNDDLQYIEDCVKKAVAEIRICHQR